MYSWNKILRNLKKSENILRLFVAIGMLLPYFEQPKPASAAQDPVTRDWKAAQQLLKSADVRTYLPAEAFLPFADDPQSNPLSSITNNFPNPQQLVPALNGKNGKKISGNTTPENQIEQVQKYAKQLEERATEKGEKTVQKWWDWVVDSADNAFQKGKQGIEEVAAISSAMTTVSEPTANQLRPQIYLPIVIQNSSRPTVPTSTAEASYDFTSPDGLVKLSVPAVNFDAKPTLAYAASVPSELRNATAPANSVMIFAVSADNGREGESLTYLKQAPATLTLSYPDTVANEEALTAYGYAPDSGRWFTLPTDIDATNNIATAQTSLFTLIALAPMLLGATQDPCAIPVELIRDTNRDAESETYPFTNVPLDPSTNNRIPQGIYHDQTYTNIFPNFAG